jgi:hypothetical protein
MSNHKMNMKPNYIPNLNMTSSMKGFTNKLFKSEVFFFLEGVWRSDGDPKVVILWLPTRGDVSG